MNAIKIFRHQNYELQCSGRLVASGRFTPVLTVSKQVWPTRPREIAVERGDFPTEQDAIEAAYQQGVTWVRDYG